MPSQSTIARRPSYIGCGEGRIGFYLAKMGYRVYAVDIKRYDTWKDSENLTFHTGDIFDLSSMPIQEPDIIICSQVLEHTGSYGMALVNMMALAKTRIIITIPYLKSFWTDEHLHFWGEKEGGEFKDVNEFKRICHPYTVAISEIRTKPTDAEQHQSDYLIIIDKRQNLDRSHRWA